MMIVWRNWPINLHHVNAARWGARFQLPLKTTKLVYLQEFYHHTKCLTILWWRSGRSSTMVCARHWQKWRESTTRLLCPRSSWRFIWSKRKFSSTTKSKWWPKLFLFCWKILGHVKMCGNMLITLGRTQNFATDAFRSRMKLFCKTEQKAILTVWVINMFSGTSTYHQRKLDPCGQNRVDDVLFRSNEWEEIRAFWHVQSWSLQPQVLGVQKQLCADDGKWCFRWLIRTIRTSWLSRQPSVTSTTTQSTPTGSRKNSTSWWKSTKRTNSWWLVLSPKRLFRKAPLNLFVSRCSWPSCWNVSPSLWCKQLRPKMVSTSGQQTTKKNPHRVADSHCAKLFILLNRSSNRDVILMFTVPFALCVEGATINLWRKGQTRLSSLVLLEWVECNVPTARLQTQCSCCSDGTGGVLPAEGGPGSRAAHALDASRRL